MRQADFEIFEPAKGFRVFVHPTTKFKTITLSLYVHQPLGELATKLAHGPTIQMGLMKLMVHKGTHQTFREHFAGNAGTGVIARSTEDHKEGVRAFIEKRKPNFKGR